MPTSARSASSAFWSSPTSMPSTTMRPLSCFSRRFSVRSKVLLPEPDAPMITATSPALK